MPSAHSDAKPGRRTERGAARRALRTPGSVLRAGSRRALENAAGDRKGRETGNLSKTCENLSLGIKPVCDLSFHSFFRPLKFLVVNLT